MKPVMIEYERKFNLGDYESETIKIHVSLDGVPGEVDQALAACKAKAEQLRTQKNTQPVGGIANGINY